MGRRRWGRESFSILLPASHGGPEAASACHSFRSKKLSPAKAAPPVGSGRRGWPRRLGRMAEGQAQRGNLQTVLTSCPGGGSRWLTAPHTPEASLFRPRLSQPSFQPSHVKVLTGSLHLLATPLSLGPSQGVYKQRSSCPEVPEFTSCGVWAAGRGLPCPSRHLCPGSRTLSSFLHPLSAAAALALPLQGW